MRRLRYGGVCMQSKKNILILGAALIALILITRSAFFQHTSCNYKEQELKLAPEIANARIRFYHSALIVHGVDREYQCLPYMGTITSKIIDPLSLRAYQEQVIDAKIEIVNTPTNMELRPIKLMSVTKHGFSSIDSGSGPILHLILTDATGQIFEVAAPTLGINEGDEFLKAVNGSQETILRPETKFTE